MPGVEVDTRALERFARNVAGGLEHGGRAVAQTAADQTARDIADRVPVLTGRLRASVTTVDVGDGYGVSYGAQVPYARKIERRDHTVEEVVGRAPDEYYRAQVRMTEEEVRHA